MYEMIDPPTEPDEKEYREWQEDQTSSCTSPSDCSVCSWQEDSDGNWLTSCGALHMFLAGNVKENRHIYCPYCGKIILEQNAQADRTAKAGESGEI